MGDTVSRPADGKLEVSAAVLRGSGSTLEFHTAAGCVHRHAIQSEDAQVEALVDVTSSPYVRAQLVGQGNQPELVRALTNPNYIR
jgi:hypothetical protein